MLGTTHAQRQAQKALGLRIARLLVGEKPLERGRTLKEEGVFDRDVLTAVVQPDRRGGSKTEMFIVPQLPSQTQVGPFRQHFIGKRF